MKSKTDRLKKIYGQHQKVARELGISQRAYQYYRHGERLPPKPVLKLMDLLLDSNR